MPNWLLWCLLLTTILSVLCAAGCVAVCFKLASRCTRVLKRRPPSELTLSQLATDQAALYSSFQSMATTVKRLSSRAGMQELRSRPAASEAPPPGASKAELRKYYGLQAAGPEFAKKQLSLVSDTKE